MDTFSIGEIAIGQGFLVNTDFNGVEGEITGGLAPRLSVNKSTGEVVLIESYQITWASGEKEHVAPKNLRKKKPRNRDITETRENPISWDDVKTFEGEPIWQPEKETV